MTDPHPPPSGFPPPPADPSWPAPPGPLGPPLAPPPKKSRTGLVVGLLAGGLALLLCCGGGIAGVAFYLNNRDGDDGDDAPVAGVVDYRATMPDALSREHQEGAIDYPMTPPAGGKHHQRWQNCMGDVYTAPIDDGDAVHSLEHGAVWITYRPDLPAEQLTKLVSTVRGKEYLMLSPYPDQPSAVSLQAWGYQLRLDSVEVDRVDAFVAKYRIAASMEPGAPCSGGLTTTVG